MHYRLHHVAITVTNLEATLRWYQEVFDMTVEKIVRRNDLKAEVYFLAGSGLRLEFFSFRDVQPLPSYRTTVDEDIRVCGTKHFAVMVADLEQAIATAEEAGACSVDGPHLAWDRGHRYAFVTDPSGTLVEFVEPASQDSEVQQSL